MAQNSPARSLFRSDAWVSAWLETWGRDRQIQIIDLGGRGAPLEMMYLLKHRIKNFVPVKSLLVAGYGFASFDPPRAEYNSLDSLISCAGGLLPLIHELKKLPWNQCVLTDICDNEIAELLSVSTSLLPVKFRSDIVYRIDAMDFREYKQGLGSSTRAKYFNRRSRLAEQGTIELFNSETPREFFSWLNQFHCARWGRPCYSPRSMDMFNLFLERIKQEGGGPILQMLRIDGEIVSVLFDVVWQGVRYNLQSGYNEKRFGHLALGSLHFGYAIEEALSDGNSYDFLAGMGKNANYKAKISTVCQPMNTYCLSRGWLKQLYRIYKKSA
jgi:hypothetical protein